MNAPTSIRFEKIKDKANYVTMIDNRTEYSDAEILDAAEKMYGVRPTSCKFGWIYPGINFEYVVGFWVNF